MTKTDQELLKKMHDLHEFALNNNYPIAEELESQIRFVTEHLKDTDIICLIDELNQFYHGNVTKESILESLYEMYTKIGKLNYI